MVSLYLESFFNEKRLTLERYEKLDENDYKRLFEYETVEKCHELTQKKKKDEQ
jgi:hypothetical protein